MASKNMFFHQHFNFGLTYTFMDKKFTLSHTTNPDKPDDTVGIHEYYLNIISNMPNNVYWLDKNCITQGCNKNVLKFIGLRRLEDFVGITYEEMGRLANWTDDQAQSFKRDDMEVIATGKPKINVEEPPFYDENGDVIYYLSTRMPLFDKNGEVMGVVGTSIDITARKKMEEQLRISKEQAEAAKSEFVQNMQHDIRTPVSGLWSVLSAMVEEESEPAKQEKLMLLRNSARQLYDICNDVIDFDKAERGEIPITSRKFNLNDLVLNVIDLNKAIALKKNLDLSFSVDSKIPKILKGDKHRISRILINLVGNAIKFTEQGEIAINVKQIQRKKKEVIIQFQVNDSGVGIPEEKINFIYEKFTKSVPSNRGIYTGSGLGLQIVKKFISDLNGEIEVESTVNKGTVFYISIPLEKPLVEEIHEVEHNNSAAVKETVTERLPEKKNTKLKITSLRNDFANKTLLIEDDPLAQIGASIIFKNNNINFILAENVADSLEILNSTKFDLVISDIGLPDGTGFDIIRSIRKNPKSLNYNTPFIALTAHNDKEKIAEAKESGFKTLLSKPLTEKTFQPILKRYLSNGNAEV